MVDILRRGVPRAEFACEVLEMCRRVVQLGEYVGVVVGRLDTWDDDLFGLCQILDEEVASSDVLQVLRGRRVVSDCACCEIVAVDARRVVHRFADLD